MNIKTVNKAIADMGGIVLHKGDGYFYFIGDNVDFSAGVYVNSINSLTLEQWIEEAKARLVAA
jgi:hypothetical protein